MTLDLVILAFILFFAVFGALGGAARQIAHWGALVGAAFCAKPLGRLIAPQLSQSFRVPQVIGVVAGSLLVFILALVLLRYVLTVVLRRLIAGKDMEHRSVDRWMGFWLGGLKIAAMAYVIVSALVFAETNVTLAGQPLGLSPKNSMAFAFAREHNLFEYAQFGAVKDLITIARATSDPVRAKRLQADPSYQALRKDARFREALTVDGMKHAIQTGDYRALLQSNPVLQLVQDPFGAEKLSAAAQAAERR